MAEKCQGNWCGRQILGKWQSVFLNLENNLYRSPTWKNQIFQTLTAGNVLHSNNVSYENPGSKLAQQPQKRKKPPCSLADSCSLLIFFPLLICFAFPLCTFNFVTFRPQTIVPVLWSQSALPCDTPSIFSRPSSTFLHELYLPGLLTTYTCLKSPCAKRCSEFIWRHRICLKEN